VNIFFSLKFRLFSRTLPSLAFSKSFKKCLTTFTRKVLFFQTIDVVPTAILTGRSVPRWMMSSSKYQKLGHFSKSRLFFHRPPTSSFDVNTFKSCLTCVECSFFKFWVFSQLENLLRRRGKDGIYALPHNLSKKFLYGMKPSSSSLSASSSRSLRTSSLGISSPNMTRKFSSSANIMVPFSFLS